MVDNQININQYISDLIDLIEDDLLISRMCMHVCDMQLCHSAS